MSDLCGRPPGFHSQFPLDPASRGIGAGPQCPTSAHPFKVIYLAGGYYIQSASGVKPSFQSCRRRRMGNRRPHRGERGPIASTTAAQMSKLLQNTRPRRTTHKSRNMFA